jgi:PAS domain S-box-containing protein
MTGNYQTLKNRLIYFSGSILLFCALIFIIQYNNFYYSGKYSQYQGSFAKFVINAGKVNIQNQQFIKSEVLDKDFYSSGKSKCTDSVTLVLSQYIGLLDSVSNDSYLGSNKLKKRIDGLISDCQSLKINMENLRGSLLERGFFNTGKAGEWTRFGIYLEDLAENSKNTSVIRSISRINRELTAYQYQRNPDQIDELVNLVFSLKVQLTSGNLEYTSGISDAEKLKLVSELDNFYSKSLEIQKIDREIGLTQNAGLIGDLNVHVNVVVAKSNQLNADYSQIIQSKINLDFGIKTILIVLICGLYFWFVRKFLIEIIYNITEIQYFASELIQGKLPKPLDNSRFTETNEISDLFNRFIEALRDKIKFAAMLGSGRQDVSLVPLSADDALSNALLDMEKSLLKAEEEDQKYKADEQKRAWANEGLAKFSEILRMQTDNLSTLSDEIIVELVKYLSASVGSIFLYNDDNDKDIYLELISAFAYDRKKFIHKRIEIGEGLVGTCAIEKLPIFLSEIPEDYMEITSGLGDAPPRSIFIVPLKTEEKIFGVLEVASFQKFEKHELEFIEKLAQSIASTFATVKINIHTARLLEQSKRQAEEMAQQEEEMRQNFEELQATQEESARREAEITSLIHAVDSSSLVIQTDMEGRIIEANKKFSSSIDQKRDNLIGRYLKHIFIYDPLSDEYSNLIQSIKEGKSITRSETVLIDEEHKLVFDVHYSPIADQEGRPYKILCIASDLTHSKQLESVISQKDKEISTLNNSFNQFFGIVSEGFLMCVLAPDTTIIEINTNYTDTVGYTAEECIGSSYRKFLKADELKQFELIWIELQKSKPFNGVIKRTTPTGEEHWLMSSFIPLMSTDGNLEKIYYLSQNITEKKLKYQVLEEANKEIERLKGLNNL